jgi:hypothetical protein
VSSLIPSLSRAPRRRPFAGACLALAAWLALLLAPIAAQAMTRIDTGVPSAVICSAGKTGSSRAARSAPHRAARSAPWRSRPATCHRSPVLCR